MAQLMIQKTFVKNIKKPQPPPPRPPFYFLTAHIKVSVPPEILVSIIFLANISASSTLTISWQKILFPHFIL